MSNRPISPTAALGIAVVLVSVAACGGQQTGPAPVERLPVLVEAVGAHGALALEPAPRPAQRPDTLLAALPADPLAVMGLDLGTLFASTADGSLFHGHASDDPRVAAAFLRLVDVLLDHVVVGAMGQTPGFDLVSLTGLAAGLYELNGEPNIIVVLPDGFVSNLEPLVTLLAREALLVQSVDGLIVIADEPGMAHLDAEGAGFVLEDGFRAMVPEDALAFVAVPDAANLPLALRFAAFAQMGGSFRSAGIALAGDGRVAFTVTGGGADHVHHRMAIMGQRLLQSIEDVPFAPPELRSWLESVAGAILNRISVAERDDGGVVVHVDAPDCGGALQNHAPMALIYGAMDYGAVARASERFVPPPPPPLAEGCVAEGAEGTITHALLPLLVRGDHPAHQELHVAVDPVAFVRAVLAAGGGLLPVRLTPSVVEPVLGLIDPAIARGAAIPAIELLLAIEANPLQSAQAGEGAQTAEEDELRLVARLPAVLADRLPVFMLVMAGFDVVDHPALGSVVVRGLSDRIPRGEVVPIDDRLAELVEALGGNSTVRLISGPPALNEATAEDAALGGEASPRPLHTVALRHRGGYWLQVIDWRAGEGPRGEAFMRRGAAAWIDPFMEGFTAGFREEQASTEGWDEALLTALIPALRDWLEVALGETFVVRERDTTVSLYHDRMAALSLQSALGIGATAMILSHLLDPARWGHGMEAPGEGAPAPDWGLDGATDDVF